MTLLNITNLSKSFGTEQILAHFDLSVADGEFVSILGPSGSGKSTLFHLVGGILTPDEGEIILKGENISGKRGNISYMPQAPSLLPWRNTLDNVILGQELQKKADIETAKEMLVKAGLQLYMNAYPNELSGGMKQRAAFIRALLSPQPILCLDEPFSALDELTRQDMQEWLLDTWEEYKKTILFVTHNIEEALFLSDRIIILSAKPAQVKAEVDVPFSRPREKKLLLEDEFFKWKRKVYTLMTSTVDEYITSS